ncbi:MAG: ArsI/CadI family heavy metal resistance metalloenzyme [Pseudomonadota bacterium]
MKRLHMHIGVENLDDSIRFYNALFNAAPVKVKADYAKWMLDDPRINFAISTRASKPGIDHLGIQTDDQEGLEALRTQISAANISTHSDGETTCCYAKSEKSWVEDPNGVAWEVYHTMEDVELFSENADQAETACCTPEAEAEKKTSSCATPSEKASGCC